MTNENIEINFSINSNRIIRPSFKNAIDHPVVNDNFAYFGWLSSVNFYSVPIRACNKPINLLTISTFIKGEETLFIPKDKRAFLPHKENIEEWKYVRPSLHTIEFHLISHFIHNLGYESIYYGNKVKVLYWCYVKKYQRDSDYKKIWKNVL